MELWFTHSRWQSDFDNSRSRKKKGGASSQSSHRPKSSQNFGEILVRQKKKILLPLLNPKTLPQNQPNLHRQKPKKQNMTYAGVEPTIFG